jgi:hypothetical protein
MKCGLAPPKRRVQYHLPSPLLFRRAPYAGQIGPDSATFVVAIASSRTKVGTGRWSDRVELTVRILRVLRSGEGRNLLACFPATYATEHSASHAVCHEDW